MNQVLSILTGKQVDSSVIDRGYCGNAQQFAGCFIKTDKVYNLCKSVVLASEKDPYDNTYTVTTEVNSQCWLRYCGLKESVVIPGLHLNEKDEIGSSKDGLFRFEYCTSTESQFPVRLLSRQLYKHDPTPVIFGNVLSRRLR